MYNDSTKGFSKLKHCPVIFQKNNLSKWQRYRETEREIPEVEDKKNDELCKEQTTMYSTNVAVQYPEQRSI